MHKCRRVLWSCKGSVEELWEFVDAHGVTHLGCVPTILSALLRVPERAGQAVNVKVALAGGYALRNELALKFEQVHGIPVRHIFGMTECAGIVSIEPLGSARQTGSVGLRLPYSEATAIPLDASTETGVREFCAPGETSTLAIRGPHVSDSYLAPCAEISVLGDETEVT